MAWKWLWPVITVGCDAVDIDQGVTWEVASLEEDGSSAVLDDRLGGRLHVVDSLDGAAGENGGLGEVWGDDEGQRQETACQRADKLFAGEDCQVIDA